MDKGELEFLCNQYGEGKDAEIDESIMKILPEKSDFAYAYIGHVLWDSKNQKIRYRAFYWFEKGYLCGGIGRSGLVDCYLQGLGCSKNIEKVALLYIDRENVFFDPERSTVYSRIHHYASFTEIYFYGREQLTNPAFLGETGFANKALKVYHRSRAFQTKVLCFLWCKPFYKDLNMKIAQMIWEMRKEEPPNNKQIKF